jgi:glycerophosphoryl diester phosphodiesterase
MELFIKKNLFNRKIFNKKYIFIVIAIMLLLPIIKIFFSYDDNNIPQIYEDVIPEKFPAQYKNIIISHGGYIDGNLYTNSYEAIEKAIDDGYNFIEIDLILSEDKVIFGGHDMEYISKYAGFPPKTKSLHSQDIKGKKILSKYNFIFAEDINNLFNKNNSLFLVTDKISDFDEILKQINFQNLNDRLLVEVFSYDDYKIAILKGIKYPMLAINNGKNLKKYLKRIKQSDIKMITIGKNLLIKYPKLVKEISDHGGTIFVYTENDIEKVKNGFNLGVTGFYSDTIKPSDLIT